MTDTAPNGDQDRITDSAARWIATKDGEVVAEAETAKELFVILHEKKITGSITQKVRATAAPHGRHAPDTLLYRGDAAIAYLADALWTIYATSGADTDGDTGPGAIIAGMGLRGYAEVVVEAVRDLRNDYQEALDGT